MTAGKDLDLGEHSPPLLVAVQTSAITLKIIVATSQKTGTNPTSIHCYTSPGPIPKRYLTIPPGQLLNYVDSSLKGVVIGRATQGHARIWDRDVPRNQWDSLAEAHNSGDMKC